MQDIIKRVFLSVFQIFRLKKELTTLPHKCMTKQEFNLQHIVVHKITQETRTYNLLQILKY